MSVVQGVLDFMYEVVQSYLNIYLVPILLLHQVTQSLFIVN